MSRPSVLPKTYAISFSEPPISHKDEAPLPKIPPIMAHYIMVLERILAKGRGDRAYCRFAEFFENRILRRALQLCMRFFVLEGYAGFLA